MARRKKTTAPAAEQLTPEELAIATKYPTQQLVAGSLAPAGQHPEIDHGTKRTIEIVCADCRTNRRRIATSDLFQCSRCKDCSAAHKKEARKTKKR